VIKTASVRGFFCHLVIFLVALSPCHGAERSEADRPPPRVASALPGHEPESVLARPVRPRGKVDRPGDPEAEVAATSGWWLGTTGIALALAVCGGISVAACRGGRGRGRWCWPPAQAGSVLRVVGRTSLSPRHTVYLLRAGDRVLIVGTGPQGAPSLLGELTDPDALTLEPRGDRQ
jgi:hypothetical protein